MIYSFWSGIFIGPCHELVRTCQNQRISHQHLPDQLWQGCKILLAAASCFDVKTGLPLLINSKRYKVLVFCHDVRWHSRLWEYASRGGDCDEMDMILSPSRICLAIRACFK